MHLVGFTTDILSNLYFRQIFVKWPNNLEQLHISAIYISSNRYQKRQRTYNVTLRRVRMTIAAMGTQKCVLCISQRYMSFATIYFPFWAINKNAFMGEFQSPANTKSYSGVNVNWPIFWSDFNQVRRSPDDFHSSSNIKFHANPSSVIRADGCRGTDIKKLTGGIRD